MPMQFRAFALAALLGLSTPILVVQPLQRPVLAQTMPQGVFQDDIWVVSLDFVNNAMTYYGENKRTGASIYLSGASVGGTTQRRIYTWNNAGTRYQITWQPSDPSFVRVQVFQPNGREILNRLLRRSS